MTTPTPTEASIRYRRERGTTPRASDVDWLLGKLDELHRLQRLRVAEHSAFALVSAWCIPNPEFPLAARAIAEARRVFNNDANAEGFARFIEREEKHDSDASNG